MIGRVVDAEGNTLASGSIGADGLPVQKPGWLVVRGGRSERVIYAGGRSVRWCRQLTAGNWALPPGPLKIV